MSKTFALELDHVDKYFSGLHAADDVCIQVEEGQIYGIIGPNGAGKTTIFNMITGIYPPSSGTIRFFGEDITGKEPHEIALKGIARTFQNIRLFGDMSVFSNVYSAYQKNLTYNFIEGIFHLPRYRKQEKEAEGKCLALLDRVGLLPLKDLQANKLPYGQQRRLEIVRALATGAKLLLLDEPAAGMNEEESARLSEIVKNIRKDFGVTIVIIDHHMDVIMDVCEKITAINFGKVLATGSAEEVQNDPDVIDAYLGRSEDA